MGTLNFFLARRMFFGRRGAVVACMVALMLCLTAAASGADVKFALISAWNTHTDCGSSGGGTLKQKVVAKENSNAQMLGAVFSFDGSTVSVAGKTLSSPDTCVDISSGDVLSAYFSIHTTAGTTGVSFARHYENDDCTGFLSTAGWLPCINAETTCWSDAHSRFTMNCTNPSAIVEYTSCSNPSYTWVPGSCTKHPTKQGAIAVTDLGTVDAPPQGAGISGCLSSTPSHRLGLCNSPPPCCCCLYCHRSSVTATQASTANMRKTTWNETRQSRHHHH